MKFISDQPARKHGVIVSMENNKYNDFHSKKTIEELYENIPKHYITGNLLEKECHDALLLHMQERELTLELKERISQILKSGAEKRIEKENEDIGKTNEDGSKTHKRMKKYSALRVISKILHVNAWILGITTIIMAVILPMEFESSESLLLSLGVIMIGSLLVLFHKAISELIIVFIDIEHNTRSEETQG